MSDAGPLERSQTGVGQHRVYIRRSVQNAYLLFGAAAVLAALCSGQFKRFAGGCLAASALIVVVLFPTTVALVHDTVQAAEAANG